jgi:hypothetical protein
MKVIETKNLEKIYNPMVAGPGTACRGCRYAPLLVAGCWLLENWTRIVLFHLSFLPFFLMN